MSDSVPDAIEALQAALGRFPAPPASAALSPEFPHPFSALLPEPDSLDQSERAELATQAAELEPWLQGPFPLGPELVLGAGGRDHERWSNLAQRVQANLASQRVLDVGCGAGYDAFAFAARNADHVLACEPSEARRQANLVNSVLESGVEFRACGWESLDPERDGRFDLVHCDGLLHRVLEPMALLRALRAMTAPGGTLLIGAMMLADPERSELLRFVPDRHAGDPGCWFIPGRLAFRWLVQTAGFEVLEEFGEREGPRDRFPVVCGYLRAVAGG